MERPFPLLYLRILEIAENRIYNIGMAGTENK